jgi:uncharacterized repeat protein (TIGR01451 family)
MTKNHESENCSLQERQLFQSPVESGILSHEKSRNVISRRFSIFVLFVSLIWLFTLSENVYAATCQSDTTGNWSTAGNWSCGHVPTSADTVEIVGSYSITVDGTYNASTLSVGPNAAWCFATTLSFNSGSQVTVTGTTTLGRGCIISSATLNMSNGGTLITSGLALNTSGATLNWTPGTGTVQLTGTNTLPSTIFTSFYNLIIASNTTTMSRALTINNNLTVNSGATFSTGSTNTWTLSVAGATSVTGTLTLANTATKTFTGDVTINSGGVWNETGAAAINFAGSLTNNATTFTANTGTHTFSGTNKTLSGTTAIVIPTATFTGAYANSGTLTSATLLTVTGTTLTNNGTINASTALSGTGGVTQGTSGILNIGGTSGITTLTATANGNTVNYNGAAQTVHNNNYYNLTLSGSGAKTLQTGTTAIGGDLTLSGTATTSGVTGLTIGGSVILGSGTTFTSGSYTHNVAGNWTNNGGTFTPGSGTVNLNGGSQTIGGSSASTFNNLTLSGSGTKTFSAAETITGTLTINSGVNAGLATGTNSTAACLILNGVSYPAGTYGSSSSAATYKNDTFFSGTGIVTVSPGCCTGGSWLGTTSTDWNTASNWCGGVPTETTDVTISSGTTYQPTIGSAGGLCRNITINNGATLTMGGAYSLTVSGDWTLNTGGTFTPSTSTVTFNGSNAVNINGSAATSFYNLTINKGAASTTVTSTSAGKAFSVGNDLTVTQGNLILQATDANYTVTNDLIVSANGTLTHSVNWDTYGKQLTVSGSIAVDGIFAYTVRSHVQMNSSGTETIRTGANSSSAFSILTLTNGTFNASGTLKINDNFWAGFNSTGVSFHTNGYNVTALAALLNAGGTIYIDGGSLSVTGGLAAGIDANNGAVNLSSGTLNTDALYVGDGTRTGTFSQSGGTSNIGNLTISSTGTYTCTNSPAINISGNWTLNTGGTFTPASSTVTFNGSSAQALGGSSSTTFNNLTINNSTGVTLGANETVSNILTLTSGKVATTSSYYLAVTNTSSSAVTGYSSSSYVNGSLQWSLVTGGSYFFPVGDDSNYRPFELNSINCSSPVVRVAMSSTGANTVDATMSSVDPRNWYAQLVSGSFISATVRITESGLGSTNLVASSSAQSGNYTSRGGNSIGSTITSNAGISYTGSTYFAVGDLLPPALTVVKSSDKSSVVTGDTVTYSITITNTGSGTATNVIATDPLPPYTTYVSNSTRLNGITVAGDGSALPLITGLLVDDNGSRTAGAVATGILPPHSGSVGVATITFQVTVN